MTSTLSLTHLAVSLAQLTLCALTSLSRSSLARSPRSRARHARLALALNPHSHSTLTPRARSSRSHSRSTLTPRARSSLSRLHSLVRHFHSLALACTRSSSPSSSLEVSVDLSIVDLDVPFNLAFSFVATMNAYANLGVLAVTLVFVSLEINLKRGGAKKCEFIECDPLVQKGLHSTVERNIDLVYGGGNVGLMGLVSQAVYDGGRHTS
ncbi:hypothetical protein Syun_004019 [Stephania yunnanensis]|uniref:Uncharacterized protein n=1 Tax=Stephania yunnanensis TaxID=152371 RepID=A0AAP0Q0D0_9MAGN